MKKKCLPTLLIGACMLVSSLTMAQPRQGHGFAPRTPNPEVQAYIQKNVVPVIQQQRQKLDTQLSAPDKVKLATFRTQLETLNKEREAFRKNFHSEKGRHAVSLTEEQKQQMQKNREAMAAVMADVHRLAQRYENQISQLLGEIATQKITWHNDIKALLEQKNQGNSTAIHHGRGKHDRALGMFGKNLRPAAFLLLKVNAPIEDVQTENYQMYPNPAVSSQTLVYQVKKGSEVTIELLNNNGKVLNKLVSGKKEAGQYSLDVNLDGMAHGMYFYRITTSEGTEIKKFLKN